MLETLIEWDKIIFLWLNGMHADWLDPVMYWISDKKIWIPFYLLIAGWIIREYKWRGIIVLVSIGLAITATDQTCSGFMKPFFERLRPSRDPAMEGLVHIVNDYRGGRFGFSSSHAGNTFSLATFLFFTFSRKYPWFAWMFLWAAVVSYSRIYLGVHYPGDIIVGAIIGSIYGYAAHRICSYAMFKFSKKS